MPSHLDVKGNEHADDLVLQGRLQHPNNMLPLSKRQRVTEWEELGLKPTVEAEERQITSDEDSGGGGGSSPASSVSESGDEDVLHSSDSDGLDVTETRLGGMAGGWGQ